jgi:hypothetical protein
MEDSKEQYTVCLRAIFKLGRTAAKACKWLHTFREETINTTLFYTFVWFSVFRNGVP